MLKKLIFIFSVCSLSVPAFDQLIYEFDDTLQEKRFYSLISEIRCPKCTSGSIASSDVPVSRDLKNKVYELIISGSSDQEIKTYVSKRFGDFSNYRPALAGANYFLWFGPLIFFALMLTVFFYKRGT